MFKALHMGVVVLRLQLHQHPKLTRLWFSAEGLPVGTQFRPPCWAGTGISAAG